MAVAWRLLCGLVVTQAAVVWVAEMSRHGSRSPEKNFPWDEDGRWAIGLGELTSMGMRQHYLLGSELRQRYVLEQAVIDVEFYESTVWMQSSDVNRTLMSAESQMTGLFPQGPSIDVDQADGFVPPIQIENLQTQLDALGTFALPYERQSFPVHTVPEAEDLMLRPVKSCQTIVNYNNQLMQTPQYNATIYASQLVVDILLEVMPGEKLAKHYLDIFNSIICNTFMGFELPGNFTEEFLQEGRDIFNTLFAMYYQEDEIARLYSAAFFVELETHLQALQSGTELTTFRYYSSHEETIAGVLAGLAVFSGPQPPFASTIVFEVSDTAGDFTIRVLYNDQEMLIPTCPSVICPLSTFINYIQLRGLPNYEQLCSNSSLAWSSMGSPSDGSLDYPGKGGNSVQWTGWMTVGLVGIAIIAGLAIVLFSRSTPTRQWAKSQEKLNVQTP